MSQLTKTPKIKGCLWNTTVCPPRQQSRKKLFLASRSQSRWQGHWPWCHLKGHHYWSMHAKYEVSISYGSKVISKVKVDDRHWQIDRQDKNNIPPIIQSGGIKIANSRIHIAEFPDSKGTLAQHSTNITSCVGPTLAFYIGPMWFCSSAHNWANMLVKSWANVWNITNNA